MKIALVLTLSIAGLAFGADPKTQSNSESQTGELRRLDSVTWDLKTHTLSWVVQKGTEKDGEFIPTGSQSYQVTPDNAMMSVASEQRDIQRDESAVLHRLLDTLSIYCAQSVIWWDHGEETTGFPGVPSLKPEQPAKQGDEPKEKPASSKPVKVLPLGIAEVEAHPKVN